jgi:hypothetical protein
MQSRGGAQSDGWANGGDWMSQYVAGRHHIVEALREELLGPAPRGRELDTSKPLVFATAAEARGPVCEMQGGQEILTLDSPISRYGVGVLYPGSSAVSVDEAALATDPHGALVPDVPVVEREPDHADVEGLSVLGPGTEKTLTEMSEELPIPPGGNDDDFDLSTANSFRPSALAISFLVEMADDGILQVSASGGRYERLPVTVQGKPRSWWVRRPVRVDASLECESLGKQSRLVRVPATVDGQGPLTLSLEVYSRPRGKGLWLLTLCLVNRTAGTELHADRFLFQTALRCQTPDPQRARILPYPVPPHSVLDAEGRSNALLYRRFRTFAVGHGCAADWKALDDTKASMVCSEALPAVAVPSISADAVDEDGRPVEVPLAELAGLVSDTNGLDRVGELLHAYERWLGRREQELAANLEEHLDTAHAHLARCRSALRRMHRGLELLRQDPLARRAFQLANRAVLIQQLRYQRQSRLVVFDARTFRLSVEGPIPQPDLVARHETLGRWRAFQIAFLLAALPSVHDHNDQDRETVELIWFPTGGGKTEAYLALTAYSILHRRLVDPDDSGLDVLMRYTLRLLTAQQFQRAAALAAALEHLRQMDPGALGREPIRIGIWVGGDTTPLRHSEAKSALTDLRKRGTDADNPFLITRCPWCSAQMGPLQLSANHAPKVIGYELVAGRVILRCPDDRCPFHRELPVLVVDEYIYASPPSILIATVDKFAMLAWRPEARALFGLSETGERCVSPPGLIIQDELHLISGPLGSMVGLYETVIDELCTDRRNRAPIHPKVISSTATIRNYHEQARALYGRPAVELFPPPALDASDSFFARYVDDEDGSKSKLFVGVHAPGLNSLQTAQIRTYTALLQGAGRLEEADRDPWWTLVCFYNSLRELGGGVSLLQTDIPDYTRSVRQREGWSQVRFLRHVLELTGRMANDEIPRAIDALERTAPGTAAPVDVCLTSNIFEVGIDIDRLSLMAVVGQPKTTSQYIQVTGRVGRRWWERPGLVVTLYSPSKPRDRSHFEQFRSYHERLYAHVEPTSVTPFSASTLTRALHAVLVAYCRQAGPDSLEPFPYPSSLVDMFTPLLTERVEHVDPGERGAVLKELERRLAQWEAWQRVVWGGPGFVADPGAVDPPLLIPAGAYIPPEWQQAIWPTPQSLRHVDAECQAVITTAYLDQP